MHMEPTALEVSIFISIFAYSVLSWVVACNLKLNTTREEELSAYMTTLIIGTSVVFGIIYFLVYVYFNLSDVGW